LAFPFKSVNIFSVDTFSALLISEVSYNYTLYIIFVKDMDNGLFIAISGPSGVGKGTIVNMLKERLPQAVYVLSSTTRTPRPGEKDGDQYLFISEEEFKKGIDEGKFLEWAQVHHGAYYGTLKEPVLKALNAGKVVIREVDLQGARLVKKTLPHDELVTIFIKPENINQLRARINHRGELSEEEMTRRMESARIELAAAGEFDYQITNSEGQSLKCFMEVSDIIKSRAGSKQLVF
jgi:guanylate kinase